MPEQRYQRVIRYVMEMPWAIKPEALGVIMDILEFRASGGVFTAEEIEARTADLKRSNTVQRRKRVAVVPLYGTIMPRARLMGDISAGRSIEDFRDDLLDADADPDVSDIILDIASPGGSVEQVPEVAEVIRNLSKPTVAVANTDAASAAYWLATQADELVVTPSGEVGSIGVWTAHQNIADAQAKAGIQTTLISAGKYKVEGHPFGPLDDEARAEMQAKVDHYYAMFVADVARGRGTDIDAVRNGFGEGRMVTAPDAVRMGMADRVATLDQVVAEREGGVAPVAIAASATITTYFDNPNFGVPGSDDRLRYDPHTDKWSCPPTLRGDHFFGHVAPMGLCLRGRADRCINPPEGDLEGFMRHYAPGAKGKRTGVVTLGNGHSDLGIGVIEASKHYDDPNYAVADIRVGRDAYGIWFSGMVRPGITKNQRYALAASDVSGHWEAGQSGIPVLCGVAAVNVGGYPKGYLTHDEVMRGVAASATVRWSNNWMDPMISVRTDDPHGVDCGCSESGAIPLDLALAFAPDPTDG